MSKPNTRELLKEWCLRKLGKPVLDINVDDDQLEDRMDEVFQYFAEYHFDGVQRTLTKHVLTADDITNEYITVADPVLAVIRILPLNADNQVNNMFNVKYQIRLNDFANYSATSALHYSIVSQHLRELDFLFSGENPIEFNRKQNRLYINGAVWSEEFTAGDYIVYEAWAALDETTYTEIYNDMFVKNYMTSLFKLQWGQNLSKFDGIALPGGVTMNGRQIMEDAREEIKEIKEQMSLNYELPVDFMVG
jgi:hypothetical protein